MNITPSDWQTPAELAAELGMAERTVKEHMASGAIPSLKIGNRRYFTPACKAEMERRALEQEKVSGWGRKTKAGAA